MLIRQKFLDVADDQGDDREGSRMFVERRFEIPFWSKIGVNIIYQVSESMKITNFDIPRFCLLFCCRNLRTSASATKRPFTLNQGHL